jgi:hypothetical protein
MRTRLNVTLYVHRLSCFSFHIAPQQREENKLCRCQPNTNKKQRIVAQSSLPCGIFNSGFSMKILYGFLSSLCYMTRPRSSSLTWSLGRVQTVKLLAVSFTPFFRWVNSSLLSPNHYVILISTCFSESPPRRSCLSLNV